MEIYVQNFDPRDPLRDKLEYQTLLVKFKIDGKQYQTVVSRKDNGHLTKVKKNGTHDREE